MAKTPSISAAEIAAGAVNASAGAPHQLTDAGGQLTNEALQWFAQRAFGIDADTIGHAVAATFRAQRTEDAVECERIASELSSNGALTFDELRHRCDRLINRARAIQAAVTLEERAHTIATPF